MRVDKGAASDCSLLGTWAGVLEHSTRLVRIYRSMWLLLMTVVSGTGVVAAEPLFIAPNELTLSYLRPDSATEPLGEGLAKEWSEVSSKVLKIAGVSIEGLQTVTPVHQVILERAMSKRLGENEALLSIISDLERPSERLAKSALLTKLKQSRPVYGLLTRLTLRFSKSIDVSAAVAKIGTLDDQALAAAGLVGYKVRASGVQLIDYTVLKAEKGSEAVPSGDPLCATSPVERVAMIGVGFSLSGKSAPNERSVLEYKTNARCAKATLQGDLALQGAYNHGIVKRICPSCYTIALEAGCGADDRSLLPTPNLAAALVLGALRDASTFLLPAATVNARLPLNLSSELSLIRDADVVLVASVGDFKSNEKHFPAAHSGIIGVGALGSSGAAYELSNTGVWVSATTVGVGQRTEYGDSEVRNVSGSAAAAAIAAARVGIFRALQPSSMASEIVSAAQGGFFGKKVDFICKEQPQGTAPVSGGGASNPADQSGSSGGAASGGGSSSSPGSGGQSNVGSGGATGSEGGGTSTGSGGTGSGGAGTNAPSAGGVPATGGVGVSEPAANVGRFEDLGEMVRIYGRNLSVMSGAGDRLFGSRDNQVEVRSGVKRSDGSLSVEAQRARQTVLSIRPAPTVEFTSDATFDSCELSRVPYQLREGVSVAVVALSEVTTQAPSQPVIGLRVSGNSNEFFERDQKLLPVSTQALNLDQIKRAGSRSYAVFTINIEPRIKCLSRPLLEFFIEPGVSLKVESVAILNAQQYLEDQVELPALFAGFATHVGVKERLKITNQGGRQGSLLHGPYLSLREPSFIRMESGLEPSRFNNCNEIYSRLTSPAGKFALSNFAINSSRIQRDISINGNPLFQSRSAIGKFSRTEECTTISPESDQNLLWRSTKVWARVPKTSQLELRHIVSSNETTFAIKSTTAISKALAHYESAQMVQATLLARFFGSPDFIKPFVRVSSNDTQSRASKKIINTVLLGEYDGGGYRVNRSKAEGLIGDIHYVSAIPAAHHDAGVVTPSGWLISDSDTKRDARVYDQVLSFKSSSQQPVGALRVLMRVKQTQGTSPLFAMTLANEVTKKNITREFDGASLTRDGAGNLWAALKLDAEISSDETQYRFTVSHRGGGYEISKVVFLSDKLQSSRELVVAAIQSGSSPNAVTHTPISLESDDRVVQSLRMEGSLTFSIPTVQRASLLPIVNLLKPQERVVNITPSHYNFLTATLSEDGRVRSERALSTAFKSNVGFIEIIAGVTKRSVSCSLPYCPENICTFPEVCSANLGAIPERERQFVTLNFEQPLSRGARELQTKVDIAGLVSKQDLNAFRYTISKESVPEVAISQAAYADIFGGINPAFGDGS